MKLGLLPLELSARKSAISPLITESLSDATREKLPWIQNIENILERNELLRYYIDSNFSTPIANILYHLSAFGEIKNDSSKLHTYSKIKTYAGKEEDLTSVSNVKHRTSMTKICL